MEKNFLVLTSIALVCYCLEISGEPIPLNNKNICGQRKIDKTVTETPHETVYGEFPWMIGVFHKKKNLEKSNLLVCGGSLIHPQVVMTASYCVGKVDISDIIVRAGEWNLESKNDQFPKQDRQISEIIHYNKELKDYHTSNDIVLLITNKPFDLNDVVKTACLPSSNINFENNQCIVNGWGRTPITGEVTDILKKVNLNVITINDCKEKLNGTVGKKFLPIDERYICAEIIDNDEGGVGNRDGGGPLNCPILNKNERYYQAGVVSFGSNPINKLPEGFNNVGYYRAWIDSNMNSKNFDQSYYTV